MVSVLLPGDWRVMNCAHPSIRVMNCARPSIRVPCTVMSGAVALSTRMAVLALVLYERPIRMPSFQKEFPC
jgi:hypothetical protein